VRSVPEGNSVRVEAALLRVGRFICWTAVVAKTTASWPAPRLFLCRLLHDSLTVVSLEDDRRRYALPDLCLRVTAWTLALIFNWTGRPPFGHLEPVLAHLIRLVNGLAARTLLAVAARPPHGQNLRIHSRLPPLSLFVTLPSLDEPGLRCQLYLESASGVTLCLKEAIRLLLQLLAKPHQQLQQPLPPQLHPLLSSLVLFPDDPDSKQPADPAHRPGQRLVRFTPRLVDDCQRLRMPTSTALAESAQQQSIASGEPECIVAVLHLSGAAHATHLLIELDNLATAPTGQQAQQQHQRRRLRDLRLGP
uniref:Adaptor-related protein complex 5 beta subunit n=1 Tax=Macrostomum lignano TaxID=282301 RepID=A0A1I8F7Y4_9PLAT